MKLRQRTKGSVWSCSSVPGRIAVKREFLAPLDSVSACPDFIEINCLYVARVYRKPLQPTAEKRSGRRYTCVLIKNFTSARLSACSFSSTTEPFYQFRALVYWTLGPTNFIFIPKCLSSPCYKYHFLSRQDRRVVSLERSFSVSTFF